MARQPTYKELEQEIKALEKRAAASREAEQSLQEQLRFLETLIDTLPGPVFYKNIDGKYTGCNTAFAEFVGRPKDEIIGKTVYDMGPKQIADKYYEKDRELFQNPGKQVYEWQVKTKSGELREVIFNKATFTDAAGTVVGLLGIISDITELKRAQEALVEARDSLEQRVKERTEELTRINEQLREEIDDRKRKEEALLLSEERYRALFVNNPIETIIVDLEGKVTGFNRAKEKGAKEKPNHRLPKLGDRMYTRDYAGKHKINMRNELMDCLRSGKSKDFPELKYNDAFLHVNISPFSDGAIITCMDITERKRAEEALRKSSEQIKLLAYSVSHDLRSPATGIYGLAKLLHKKYGDILDEKGKKCCESILEASEQIAELVGNINIYISTKEMPLSIETVQLRQLLQMVRDEFSAQLDIRKITWSQPESMPEINADRLSVLRVLRNLVENALKHGGDDLSEVTIGYGESDEFHILSVSNDGLPIKLEDPENLFRPFQRHETSEGMEGTGLGLSIVKELAEQHGGMIRVESRPPKGVTFHIFISRYL